MTLPVEVLITLPFSDELVAQLRGVSPRLNITLMRARKPDEIPSEAWQTVEVLYTDRVLPPPEQVPNLRWIQFHWAGVDHAVDAPLLQKPGLVATTLSGAASSQMAEHALMMLLALGHHLPDLIAFQKRAEWPRDRWERFSPLELRGSTVGIIGYGSVGRQIARLLREFGAIVLATKRDVMHPQDTDYIPEGLGDPEAEFVHRLYPPQAIRSMLRLCDFVIVTAPLTPETHHMIGAEELAVLKPTCYWINISRGEVVNPQALLEVLSDMKIAGAALDVFGVEPLPPDHPLWKLPNVIITQHISGNTAFYNERAVALFSENLHRYLAGLPLYNSIAPQRGY